MPLKRRKESDTSITNNDSNSQDKKSDDDVFAAEEPRFSFEDLILPSHIKEQILSVADYAQNSKKVFEDWGVEKTHRYSKRVGINLYGPSGTGKTMAAHALAKYLGRKILVVNYAEIESKYVGETPKNIHKVFEAAKKSNSIIFFDEADAILSRRVTNMTHATDASVNQTRSEMLMILNNHQDFIIFATNFIENFDPAFMRRIAMHIKFELPDYECRCQLWKHYMPDSMPTDAEPDYLAKQYEGVSGSDISNAVLMAAFKAARNKENLVLQKYLSEAIENALASKQENVSGEPVTTRRVVSEEYVKAQLNK